MKFPTHIGIYICTNIPITSSLLTSNAFMDIFMIGFAEIVVVNIYIVGGKHATPTMGCL